jgi:biopolymer transport protein ExbD
MKRFFILLLLPTLFISCSSDQPQKNIQHVTPVVQNETLELVDVRIYEEGDIRINGEMLTESSLESNLDALPLTESTEVRITSSDEVYTGLVHRVLREMAGRNLTKVNYDMLNRQEFKAFKSALIVDVLNNGKIMLDGNLLFPDDLAIALEQMDSSNEGKTVKLNIANNVTFGMVTDIQKIVKRNHPLEVSYSKTRS